VAQLEDTLARTRREAAESIAALQAAHRTQTEQLLREQRRIPALLADALGELLAASPTPQ
jgi:hypothetical protein